MGMIRGCLFTSLFCLHGCGDALRHANSKGNKYASNSAQPAAVAHVSSHINTKRGSPMQITTEKGIQIAAQDVGLRDFVKAHVAVETAPLSHESLPFLNKELHGRGTLRIVFTKIELTAATRRTGLSNSHVKELVVFLAPDSHRVMKVTSAWPEGIPRIADYPACAEEQRQMGDADRYAGLPSKPPKVSLAEALEKCQPWGPDVKQIHACYVLHSTARYTDRPVWVIQLRGISPIPFSVPGGVEGQIPEDARNHLRNIIDAETGEWLGADTTPQPAGPLEKRY